MKYAEFVTRTLQLDEGGDVDLANDEEVRLMVHHTKTKKLFVVTGVTTEEVDGNVVVYIEVEDPV